MQVVYAKEKSPQTFSRSIFLAGPTPRSKQVTSWRREALELFESVGYDGVVFVPEPHDGNWKGDYIDQVEWEEMCLHIADCILFWIPRNLETMPALTTNVEWGAWQDSGKVVLGTPPDAVKVRYLQYYAEKFNVLTADTLKETISVALDLIGEGLLRSGGEREVPLYIWRTSHFQGWYSAQKQAGNRLDGARVEWVFRVGPKKSFVLFWILHVDIYVAGEKRHKINEVVISRPDIATIVMYRKSETGQIGDTDIVLIKEFRSSAITKDGFVWEVPSGSSFKSEENPLELVAVECYEETGLEINSTRIHYHESRQLVATVSTHRAYLFSVEITKEELDYLYSQKGIPHGVFEETERTYIEIMKFRDIKQTCLDWSMTGMIMYVLMDIYKS